MPAVSRVRSIADSSPALCANATLITGEIVAVYTAPVSNPGLLWLDDEGAKRLIDEKARAGEITPEEAENLGKFAVDGYFITKVNVTADDAAEIDRDVDRLWREKPSNLSFAYDSPP